MANVLVLTLIFSPDNVSTAQLVAGIAEDLKSYGHEVRVISTTPHYHRDPSLEEKQPLDRCLGGILKKSWLRGIPVYHIRMPNKNCSKWLRILSWLFFHGFSTIVGLCIRFKPDIILVPSPPLSMGLNAYALGRLLGAKYIYNVQELYPDIAINLGVVRNRCFIRALSAVERFIYNHAVAVTTITDSIDAKVRQRCRQPLAVHMVPNFVDLDEIADVERDNAFSRMYHIADCFVVTYAGNLGVPQNLMLLVEAAVLLRDRKNIAFMIVGDGSEKNRLRAAVQDNGLSNIHVVDYQPISMMPSIYAASDIFYVGQQPEAHTDGIPSKIYRIFGNKKPILAVTAGDSDLANCVRQANGGVVVTNNDPQALAAAVVALCEAPEKAEKYGSDGYAYVRKFSRTSVSQSYDQLIRACCQRKQGGGL